MEPLSITAGCLGIISTIAKTSASITHFVRNVRDSRRELSETKQQLAELEMTLNLINDDHDRENGNLAKQIPEGIVQQTKLVLDSCRDILVELDGLIVKYNSERHRAAFQWARKGKDEVGALNKQLEAHARTLHMSLEFSTLVWSRIGARNTVVLRQESQRIIENTEQVLDDTGEIKLATTQILDNQAALKDILAEVEEIKASISQQEVGVTSGRQDVMRRYLDSLTDYGESEMGGESPTNSTSMPGDLTPPFDNMFLEPIVDPFDLQENGVDHRHHCQRTAIPESTNASEEVQSTWTDTWMTVNFGLAPAKEGIKDVYIGVMSATGSETLPFISRCAGKSIAALQAMINHYFYDVCASDFMWSSHIRVVMIALPGRERAYNADSATLKYTAWLLRVMQSVNVRLSGIVYLHCMTSPGLEATDPNSLDALKALFGSQYLEAVTPITPCCPIDGAIGIHEGLTKYYYPCTYAGDRWRKIERYDTTVNSAREVVEPIIERHNTSVLDFQGQVVDE